MTARHRARDDLAWLLLRHGYGFSAELRRRRLLGPPSTTPAVEARLGGSRVVLLGGPPGVAAFTDTARLSRTGATPRVVGDVLFGAGAVHGLDDAAHRRRKELFVEALDGAAVDDLVRRVATAWSQRLGRVRDGDHLVVQQASARLVGRAVIEWAGIDVPSSDAAAAADRFAAIVDGFGSPGPWARARVARERSDRWAEGLVRAVRDGRVTPPQHSALDLVSRWPDVHGGPLPTSVGAVELQNLLRPAVAASRLIAFAALALVGHPRWAQALRDEHATGEASLTGGVRGPVATAFAREVRRLAPFVPLLAARARADAKVLGVTVDRGERVLLDVVGTLRDPVAWPEPMSFRPERFLGSEPVVADALVPQGGGSVVDGHRCPGEDPVLGILACSSTALALVADGLVGRRRRVDERRIPAEPPDGAPLRLRRPPGGDA